MSFYLCTFVVVVFLSCGLAEEVLHELVLSNVQRDPAAPLEFPKKSDPSAPIVSGTLLPLPNIPPKRFPSDSAEQTPTGPPILSITDTDDIKKIKQSHMNMLNRTQNEKNTTASEKPIAVKTTQEETPEQEDMLHSKYNGGQDVDELKQPKKASEKDEKKETQSKKDPNSEVDVTTNFDKKGPKSMNETKLVRTGPSMVESASKMVAMSSSMLLNTQPKHQGIIEPTKTIITVLLSAGFILVVGVIGLLVWKRISMRKFGRDVLINEDDFDEVSDMQAFDRAQIQIT